MEKQNNEYLDLMPKQEDNTGFELDLTAHDKGLEGVPTMDLGIGITDF